MPIKPDQLTLKQEKFIEYYCNQQSDTFGNAYRSYIKAGYSNNPSSAISASQLLNNPKMAKHIADYRAGLKAKEAQKADISRDYYINQLIERYNEYKASDHTNALKAFEMVGKVLGLYIDRKEIEQTNHNVANITPQELEALEAIARANNIRLSQKQG